MSTYIPILWPPHVKSWLIGKDSDAGRDLGAGGEGDNRGWDGWMASLTGWTWVWVNSGSWWWTGRPGVLQFTGSQKVGHEKKKKSDTTERLIWSDIFTLLSSQYLEHFLSCRTETLYPLNKSLSSFPQPLAVTILFRFYESDYSSEVNVLVA